MRLSRALGALLAGAGAACARRPAGPEGLPLPAPVAKAVLKDSTGARVGVAAFTLTDSGAYLGLSVGGLTPGFHGVHVHELPNCTGPDFESAGPHFNPAGREHGLENPSGHHAGDLPNLRVKKDGSADTTFRIDPALLRSDSTSYLRDAGTALVIHAGPDDQRTQPSGASGSRVACGVIQRQ